MADIGLFDFLQSPQAALGLNLMAAGDPSTDPNRGFGTRAAGAIRDTIDQTTAQQMKAAQLFAAKQKASLLALGIQGLGGANPTDAATAAPGSPGSLLGAAPSQAPGGVLGGAAPASAPVTAPVTAAAPTDGGAAVATPVQPQSTLAGSNVQPGLLGSGQRALNAATALKLGGEADILPNIQAGLPKWEMHDGVAIDFNPITNPSFKGGPQGFVSKSADGKVVQGIVGPDGQLHVAPVEGAVSTFGQFETASAEAKAKNQESRQSDIVRGGRKGSVSVFDAVRGVGSQAVPGGMATPGSGTPPVGAAPTPAPVIGRGPQMLDSTGGTVGPEVPVTGSFMVGPDGRVDVARAEASIYAYPPGPVRDQMKRALQQQQTAEALNAPAAPGVGALPPPSPIVAQSGTPPPLIGAGAGVRTNFQALPGQGTDVAGGTEFSGPEKAAQGGAKTGIEEQAKLDALREAEPAKFMSQHYQTVVAPAAQNAPVLIEKLQHLLDISGRRGLSTVPLLSTGIGMLPSNVISDMDAYNKDRAQILQNMPRPSDKAGDTNEAALPPYNVDQKAQQKALKDLIAQTRASQVQQQVLSPYVSTPTPSAGNAYVKSQAVLTQNLSPAVAATVAPILAMPKGPARGIAIEALVKSNPAAAAVLREAARSGALQ